MNILNLYAGLGGNRLLWPDHHRVWACESNALIAEQYDLVFPDDLVTTEDALAILVDEFESYDFIWASPPCQTHSKMTRSGQNQSPRLVDMSLWQIILFLQEWYEGDWCVENVQTAYTPLIPPTASAGRHWLWSNKRMDQPPQLDGPPDFKHGKANDWADWLGMPHMEKNIYVDGNHCPAQVYRNCVHPLVGLWALEEITR